MKLGVFAFFLLSVSSEGEPVCMDKFRQCMQPKEGSCGKATNKKTCLTQGLIKCRRQLLAGHTECSTCMKNIKKCMGKARKNCKDQKCLEAGKMACRDTHKAECGVSQLFTVHEEPLPFAERVGSGSFAAVAGLCALSVGLGAFALRRASRRSEATCESWEHLTATEPQTAA
mmetsp:Transcript_109517/g.339970  ORF Transcript_109517/g.339970 Transcript_109517/m.339970 type:complete len:172 (+) Transcript_109517:499-1014(+)